MRFSLNHHIIDLSLVIQQVKRQNEKVYYLVSLTGLGNLLINISNNLHIRKRQDLPGYFFFLLLSVKPSPTLFY
jgi:hypothetical protein